jgi:hypothetical protein
MGVFPYTGDQPLRVKKRRRSSPTALIRVLRKGARRRSCASETAHSKVAEATGKKFLPG